MHSIYIGMETGFSKPKQKKTDNHLEFLKLKFAASKHWPTQLSIKSPRAAMIDIIYWL